MCNLHDKKNHLLLNFFVNFFTCLSMQIEFKKKVPHLIYIPKSFSLNNEKYYKKKTREIRIYVAMENSDSKLYFNGVITVFQIRGE